jgi:membrane-bound lytic murein transglycosylase A
MNARSIVMLSICLMTLFIPLGYTSELNLKKVSIRSLPGWREDASEKFIPALVHSCTNIVKQKIKPNGTDPRTTNAWQRMCQLALKLPPKVDRRTAKRFLESWFNAYAITSVRLPSQGLFTGYYEPSYPGSEHQTSYYNVPIYAYPNRTKRQKTPQGEIRLLYWAENIYRPIPSREEISNKPLLIGAPVLAWVHSKIDRFFLEIQGSGSIITPEGKRILLGYAGQNGHAYFPIGRHLVETGALNRDNVSMQSIRAWLVTHPDESDAVMNRNPSFVFFRKLDTNEPIGAQGVPLTPGRLLSLRYSHFY